MKDYPAGLDGDEADVTRLIPLPHEEDRERARARQNRESATSTIFVAAMFLIAMLPLIWAGVR